MKSLNLNIGIIFLILLVIVSNAVYIVNDKQTAILLRFGEIVNPEINPGLHFKVPIYHSVKKFDSRVLTLDALPQPYFTAEKKRLIVDAFVKWRITNNEQFYITSSGGQLSAMRTLLTQRVDEGLEEPIRYQNCPRSSFWRKRPTYEYPHNRFKFSRRS